MRARAACLTCWALLGCGDALVTDQYRGERLFQVEGRVGDFRDTTEQVPFRASIFWSLTGRTTVEPKELVEQSSLAVTVTFPATFTINIFEPPDSAALATVPDPYYVGEIMVYADSDENGRASQSEFRGGALRSALLYAPRAIRQLESPTGRTLPQGFTLVNLPLNCFAAPTPEALSDDNCGVPLGEPCKTDADCGDQGQCITKVAHRKFPNGYCVLPHHEEGCAPSNGVLEYLRGPATYPLPEPDLGVWVRSCESNADCRPDGYACQVYNRACLPNEPVFIDIIPAFIYEVLCTSHHESS